MGLKRTAGVWLGLPAGYAQILALAEHWRRQPNSNWAIVVDAMNLRFAGIGAGLASFLSAALPDRVIPVVFSTKTKSDLGWNFVGAVETSRYRDYLDDNEPDTRQYWHEVKACMAASASPPPARN